MWLRQSQFVVSTAVRYILKCVTLTALSKGGYQVLAFP